MWPDLHLGNLATITSNETRKREEKKSFEIKSKPVSPCFQRVVWNTKYFFKLEKKIQKILFDTLIFRWEMEPKFKFRVWGSWSFSFFFSFHLQLNLLNNEHHTFHLNYFVFCFSFCFCFCFIILWTDRFELHSLFYFIFVEMKPNLCVPFEFQIWIW